MKDLVRAEQRQRRAFRVSAALIGSVAVLGLAMTGCAGWPGPYASKGHLLDNPFDHAIRWEGDYAAIAKEARRRLLLRFPIGSPSQRVRRYVESIGGTCPISSNGPTVCRYSQYWLLGERGLFGVIWRERYYFDLTIRLLPGEGPIRDVTVCQALTREMERSPGLDKWQKPREGKFKPCAPTTARSD
jgi:hypothetical protein